MNFDTIKKKITDHYYHDTEDFMNDIIQLHTNCEIYNGSDHPLTLIAVRIVETAENKIHKLRKQLQHIVDELNTLK